MSAAADSNAPIARASPTLLALATGLALALLECAVTLLVVLYALVVPRNVGERYGRAALATYACHAILVVVSVVYRVIRPVYFPVKAAEGVKLE